LEWRPVAFADWPAISTSVTAAETETLRELTWAATRAHLADPHCGVLEIGSAYGWSAAVMASAGAVVTAVDPHSWLSSAETMRVNLAACRVADRVTIDQRVSFVALPDLAVADRRFGLIFVDGDHAEATVEHDVTWAVKLLAPGGVLACHDYGEDTCPGVAAALDRLLGPPPELVDTLAIYRGLA
jgi:predicted O-methyltransferase YrrM